MHKLNFRKLPDMVDWVRTIGATAINFQPVEQVTDEAKDEFWIGPEDLDDLIAVKDRLLEMKRKGAPILNTELLLNLWPNHFRREKAPREAMPCRIGMRNYFIRSDGRVEDVLELSADRQRAHPDGARNLVRQGRNRAAQRDRRLRNAVPVHLPVAEESRRQGQNGHEAVTPARGVTRATAAISHRRIRHRRSR